MDTQPSQTPPPDVHPPTPKPAPSMVAKIKRLNPFIILLITAVVVGVMVIVFVSINNDNSQPDFAATELSPSELQRLNSAESEIETNAQTFTISPNTVLKNNLEVQKSVEVTGDLTVYGEINWQPQGSSSEGTGSATTGGGGGQLLQSAQITNDLLVGGNSQFNGAVTINGGLIVNGGLSVSALSISELTVTGDLKLNRHIVSGGGAASGAAGGAVGGGGTINVSGDDTAGTVRINTGSNAPAGRLVTVSFRIAYGGTPSVQITPVGSGSAAVDYYIERTSSGFSIYSLGDTPDSAQIQFDYFVVQ